MDSHQSNGPDYRVVVELDRKGEKVYFACDFSKKPSQDAWADFTKRVLGAM